MTEKIKTKIDAGLTLSLIYIIPWAIGGTLTWPVALIFLATHISSFPPLSYDWWLNIIIMILALKSPILDFGWLGELERQGFIKNKAKLVKTCRTQN